MKGSQLTPEWFIAMAICVIGVTTLVGGYFNLTTPNAMASPPDSMWDVLTSSVNFFWSILWFKLKGAVMILSFTYWILGVLAGWSVAKLVRGN